MVNKRHKKSIAKRIATTALAAVLASGSFAGLSTPVYAAENNSGQFFTKDGTVSVPSYNYDNINVIGHHSSTTGNGMEANSTKYWYGNNAFYLLPQKNDGHVNEMVSGLVGTGNQVTAWELADTDATWGGDKFSTTWFSSNDSDASQILGKYESIYTDSTGKYMSKGEKEALVNANIGADYGVGTFKDSHGKVDKTGQNCNINDSWVSYSQDIKKNAVKEGVHVFLPSYHEYDSTTTGIRGSIFSAATAATGKSCVWARSFWGCSNYYSAWKLYDSGGSFDYRHVTDEYAAAPAFYLDLNKVVMPRSAEAAAVTAASSSLASYNPGNPANVKFLLKTTDWAPSFTVSALSNKEITNAAAGCTYEFSYANAATTVHASSDADKFYISAIIYDGAGNIKYYGRLKEITEATGKASITIPSGLSNDTTYTLAIFEEQGSSNHYSDYQSAGVSYSKFVLNGGINVNINSGVTLRDESLYTKDEIAEMVVVKNDHGDVIDKDHYYVLESSVYNSLAAKDEATIKAQEQTVTTEEISTYNGSYQKSVTFISFTGSQPATAVANFTVSADPSAIYTNWDKKDWDENASYSATENGVKWTYRLDKNGNIVYLYTTQTNLSSITDANGNLNLPVTIGGLPVIGIGGGDATKPVVPSVVSDSWQNVEAITIPYTVQHINECAFYGWKARAKVTIPSTVTSIASKAFYNSYITELYINGTSAEKIAYRAFANCDNLKVVRITGHTTVDKESFAGCDKLENLELDGTITVNPYAFANDTAIKKLYLPNGITLEGFAFSGCSGITDLQLGISNVVDYAFDGCVKINNLILENTVSKLETNWAGNSGTYAARNIFVYNGNTIFCTSGGDSAFGGSNSVVSVFFPNNGSPKGDLEAGNCETFIEEGSPYPTARGKATSIIFNTKDSIDGIMVEKGVASVNTLSDIQTGIEAYFSGTLIETLNLDKSKMTVLKRFGTKTNGQYDSSDFYVVRADEYRNLYTQNKVTKDAIANLEPVTPTKADLNNQLSNTLAVAVVVFDENGDLGHKLDAEDKSSCYFMAPVSVRIEAYSAESVITGFGSYQSILDKIESLNKEVSELEAKKDSYGTLIDEYQSMLDELNSALAGTGTDEDGNPIDIDTYIKKLEDAIEQIRTTNGLPKNDGTSASTEASTKLAQLNKKLDELKADYDKLEDKSSDEAKALKEQIASKEAEIAAMQKVKDQLEAIEKQVETSNAVKEQVSTLSDQIATLTTDKASLAEQLAEATQNFNSISQELSNLEQNYKDKMVGYVGSDTKGNMYVYLDGVACKYDESTAKDETYVDDKGGTHPVKVYTATDPDGKSFEFFTMLDGIYVKEGSGYKVYEDTLSETLHKADTKLKEIQGNLVDLSREISDIYDVLNEAGVTVSKGKNDDETMQNIKDAVQDVLGNYKDMKDKYADIKTAIYGDDLSAEDLDKKTVSEVVSNIKALSAGLDGVKAEIESALAGKNISAEDARELSTLLDEIKKMKATLDTDADTFTSIKDILNVSDNKDVVDGISNLYKQLDKLTKQVETLNGQVSTLQSTNDALTSTKDDLQKKIEALEAENEALKKGQSTTPSTPSTPSGDTDVDARITEMQTKINALSNNNSLLQSKVDSLSNDNKSLQSNVNSLKSNISSLESTNQSLQSQLSSVKNTADTASSNASSAKSTADTANSTANSARTTANSALSTAQSAGNGSNSGQVSSLQSTVSNLSGKVSALENQNSELQSELAAVKATANTRNASTTTNNTKTDNKTTTTNTTDTTTMDPDDASVAGNNKAAVTSVKDNTRSTTFTTTTKDENSKLLDSSVIDTTALDGSFNSGEANDNKFNSGEGDEANKLSSDIPVADNTEIEEPSGGLSGRGIAILSVLGAGVLGGLGFAGFKLFGGKGKKGNIDLDDFDDEDMDIEDPDIDDSDDDDFNF